jgi:prepilin peptidase CpaA
MAIVRELLWIAPALLAAIAGWKDLRTRRIPNWLTVPALGLGIFLNSVVGGWSGARSALLGAGLGLGILLPFVLIRSLGAGDWKLVGAMGAFLGPDHLVVVLMATIMVAGVMALVLVIWKKRVRQTARNMARLLKALFTFHPPGPELTLDNPESTKVPFGVALAVVVLLDSMRQGLGFS